MTTFDPIFAILWLIGMIAALGAAWQAKYHRLAALVMLGVSGLVTCLTFIWLSAPDLAITQLLVEIVTTVLILLGLRWLPKRFEKVDSSDELPAQLRRARDFLLAAASGIGMSVIAYAVMTLPVPNAIATYFLERAYTEGGGTNVVNVILVDFRGFDTFGEIAVLAIVALTVFALLRRFRPAHESIGLPEQQQMQNAFDAERPDRSKGDTVRDYLYVPSIVMQWMFPVIITFSIFLFMRGHDLPGGGFAAGITMAIAFLLQYLAGGALGGGPHPHPAAALDGFWPVDGDGDRYRLLVFRLPVPDLVFPVYGDTLYRQNAHGIRPAVRSRCLFDGRRLHRSYSHSTGTPIVA